MRPLAELLRAQRLEVVEVAGKQWTLRAATEGFPFYEEINTSDLVPQARERGTGESTCGEGPSASGPF